MAEKKYTVLLDFVVKNIDKIKSAVNETEKANKINKKIAQIDKLVEATSNKRITAERSLIANQRTRISIISKSNAMQNTLRDSIYRDQKAYKNNIAMSQDEQAMLIQRKHNLSSAYDTELSLLERGASKKSDEWKQNKKNINLAKVGIKTQSLKVDAIKEELFEQKANINQKQMYIRLSEQIARSGLREAAEAMKLGRLTRKESVMDEKQLISRSEEMSRAQIRGKRFWQVIGMNGQAWKEHNKDMMTNKEGVEVFDNASGNFANTIRKGTHGLRLFKMEMLGVMFFGMNLANTIGSASKQVRDMLGLSEYGNLQLQLMTLDTMLPHLDTMYDTIDTVIGGIRSIPGGAEAFGTLTIAADIFGNTMSFIGSTMLGLGSMIQAFGGAGAFMASGIGKLFKGIFSMIPGMGETGFLSVVNAFDAANIAKKVAGVTDIPAKIMITDALGEVDQYIDKLFSTRMGKAFGGVIGGALIIHGAFTISEARANGDLGQQLFGSLETALGGFTLAKIAGLSGAKAGMIGIGAALVINGVLADESFNLIDGIGLAVGAGLLVKGGALGVAYTGLAMPVAVVITGALLGFELGKWITQQITEPIVNGIEAAFPGFKKWRESYGEDSRKADVDQPNLLTMFTRTIPFAISKIYSDLTSTPEGVVPVYLRETEDEVASSKDKIIDHICDMNGRVEYEISNGGYKIVSTYENVITNPLVNATNRSSQRIDNTSYRMMVNFASNLNAGQSKINEGITNATAPIKTELEKTKNMSSPYGASITQNVSNGISSRRSQITSSVTDTFVTPIATAYSSASSYLNLMVNKYNWAANSISGSGLISGGGYNRVTNYDRGSGYYENIISGLRYSYGSDPGDGYRLITALANGGIVTRPTLALIGESGPEAVVPLNNSGSQGLASTITNNVYIDANLSNDIDMQQLAEKINAELQWDYRRSTMR